MSKDIKQKRLFSEKKVTRKTFEELLEEYLRYSKALNRSEYTIKAYKYHSKYFLEFIGKNFLCEDIDIHLIEEYLLYLRDKKGLTNGTTLNSYIRNLSPIIKYGYRKGYIYSDFEFPTVEEQEKVKEIYTAEELDKLLEKPKSRNFVEIRTWTMIITFASTGIRLRELRELKIKNVNMIDRTITLNDTKNKKSRILPISMALMEALQDYFEYRGGESEEYLFCNVFGEKISQTAVQKSIKDYNLKRGVNKYSIHLFRHTFITNAVNQNVSPLILKKITGHTTMKELNRYYNASPRDIVNIIDDIAPKPTKKKKFFK